jgi:hypothetical protein
MHEVLRQETHSVFDRPTHDGKRMKIPVSCSGASASIAYFLMSPEKFLELSANLYMPYF